VIGCEKEVRLIKVNKKRLTPIFMIKRLIKWFRKAIKIGFKSYPINSFLTEKAQKLSLKVKSSGIRIDKSN
jgi:hypothetical protein